MEIGQYYLTTITNAFIKIGPVIGVIVIGYLIFVKLPFLFLLKNMDDQKKLAEEELKKKAPIKEIPKLEEKKRPEEKAKSQTKPKVEKISNLSAEAIFELTPGKSYSQEELKKKYLELLKMNHPDKVASLGSDFKTLAEKKTKEINSAYEKLKSKKAS